MLSNKRRAESSEENRAVQTATGQPMVLFSKVIVQQVNAKKNYNKQLYSTDSVLKANGEEQCSVNV